MSSSVECGKQECGKHLVCTRSCLDRISSLPDELLAHMLSFLPTKCAVSTSVLSTRWRHLFTLSTFLSFDDTPCFDDGPYIPRFRVLKYIDPVQRRRFRKFVGKVLELHQIVPIKKFSLVCYGDYNKSDINAWVSHAVKKGVEDLHYQVNMQKVHEPPNDIFMCETLARLKMIGIGDYVLKIPLSACFPRLKILYLNDVIILDNDSAERLFSGCELLEELTLKSCVCGTRRHVTFYSRLLKILIIENCSFQDGLFEIDAPNLAHLTYNFNPGVKLVPSWKDSCSLANVELYFGDSFAYDALRYDFELLKATAHKVTVLQFFSSVELLLTLFKPEEMPDFPRLSRLYLFRCHYLWEYLTRLLDKSPQLETVIFEWGPDHRYGSASPPNKPLPVFSCHAKVIEVHHFCGSEYAFLFMGILLRNSGSLKKLILHKVDTDDMEEELRICEVLLTLPKASKDCCIELD